MVAIGLNIMLIAKHGFFYLFCISVLTASFWDLELMSKTLFEKNVFAASKYYGV